MIAAARWVLMLAAAALMLWASGTTTGEEQAAGLRLAAAAAVGTLAPLFWPGRAATAWGTLARITAWAAAAAAGAALLLAVVGRLPQPRSAVLATGAMLLLMLLPVHALAAWLERRWPRRAAGFGLVAALVLTGALPLWAGPAAELLATAHPGALDAVVGASPLTHLALAGGNDLLRNEWFYANANLAALPLSYPGLAGVVAGWAIAGAAALTLTFIDQRRSARAVPLAHPAPTKEPSR